MIAWFKKQRKLLVSLIFGITIGIALSSVYVYRQKYLKVNIYSGYAIQKLDEKDYFIAIEFLGRAIGADDPNNCELCEFLAEAYFKAGREDLAIDRLMHFIAYEQGIREKEEIEKNKSALQKDALILLEMKKNGQINPRELVRIIPTWKDIYPTNKLDQTIKVEKWQSH